MTNTNVFKAILAMDSYNRGYNEGIVLPTVLNSTKLGSATITSQSDVTLNSAARDAGFYAVAYSYSGEQVISIRGTDDLPDSMNPLTWTPTEVADIGNGWIVGAGALPTSSSQAQIAIEFYQTVVGAGNWQSASVSLTGHSMGGGLAGLVASLYGQEAQIYDAMPFTDSLINTANAISTNTVLKTLIYGSATPWAQDQSGVDGAYLAGEALETPRELSDENNFILDMYLGAYDTYVTGLDAVDLHSMSTLVISTYASEMGIETDWHSSAKYFWPVLYDDAFAENITGMSAITGTLADDEKWSDMLRTAIAYSAIDEGTRVYGDTGIVAMFEDANKLGLLLSASGASANLDNFGEDISKAFIQYAGELALNHTLQSIKPAVLGGVLNLSSSGDLLTVDFGEDTWRAAGHPWSFSGDIAARNDLFASIAEATGSSVAIQNAMLNQWESGTSEIFYEMVFAALDTSAITLSYINSMHSENAGMFIGGQGVDTVYGTAYQELLLGFDGNDTIYGEDGADILVGGTGVDTLYGGDGYDVFIGQGNGTGLDGDTYQGKELTEEYYTNNASYYDYYDLYPGRAGDTLDYSGLDFAITINGQGYSGTAQRWNGSAGIGAVDHFSSIDTIIGTKHNDYINITTPTSDSYKTKLSGGEGEDTYVFNLDSMKGGKFEIIESGSDSDTVEFNFSNASAYAIASGSWEDNIGFRITSAELVNNVVTYVARDFNIDDGVDNFVFGGNSISFSSLQNWIDANHQNWLEDPHYDIFKSQWYSMSDIGSSNPSVGLPSYYGPGGFGVGRDTSGNITSITVDPALGNNWIASAHGAETLHPFILTSFASGPGHTSASYSTSVKEITLASAVNLSDVHINANGNNAGNASLTITIGSSFSFQIPDFEAGKTIFGIGAINSDYYQQIANSSSASITSNGSGNYSGSYNSAIGFLTSSVNVTYFFEKLNYGNGSINMLGTLTFNGTSGNDTLYGLNTRGDIMNGGDGNDMIFSHGGDDVLNGGAGNDQIFGGTGDDTYIFEAGIGNDIAYESDDQGFDTIRVYGLDPNEVRLWTEGGPYLYLGNKNDPADRMTIIGHTWGDYNQILYVTIEQIVFDDNTVWDLTAGWTLEGSSAGNQMYGSGYDDTIYGMDGDDFLTGYAGNDHLYGGAGSDFLYAKAGDDTLDGGAGNDYLYGHEGDDTYLFGSGYGNDWVIEYPAEGTDVIKLTDFNAANVRMWLDNDYALNITSKSNSADNLRVISASYSGFQSNVETLVFADTTVLDLNGGLKLEGTNTDETVNGTGYNDTLYGHGGNDNLYGRTGNDTLDGGAGTDYLVGGEGNDTYLFGSGYGSDRVMEYTGEGTDIIKLTDLNSTDVRMWLDSSYNLNITSKSDALDNLIITSSSYSTYQGNVETLIFADNSTVNLNGGLKLGGTNSAETVNGTAYDDTLYGYGGSDYLYGKGGADTFVFDATGLGSVDMVMDFSIAEGDKLDISEILFGYDPLTSLIDDFISLTTVSGSTNISVDRDGAGSTYSSQAIATLVGVTGLDADTMLANGNLIA